MAIQIKRIYDPVQKSDGIRLLVDRLWPRGISKEAVQLDGWPKELTPSTGFGSGSDTKKKNLMSLLSFTVPNWMPAPMRRKQSGRLFSRAGIIRLPCCTQLKTPGLIMLLY